MLRQFARYLKDHHLEALAQENLRRSRALDTPVLRLLTGIPEPQLLAMIGAAMEQFLTDLIEDKILETAAKNLQDWEEDKMAGVRRDEISPSDLVLMYTANKQALIAFIPHFAPDAATAIPLVDELEAKMLPTQTMAIEMLARLREEDGRREATLRLEKEAAERHVEELQAMNEELQGQQEELESLYDQLHVQNEQIEAQVAERTAELSDAIERLHQADQVKDEFLSVISHELRTPLNFITGFASILDDEVDGPLNPLQHLHLGKILSGSERMLHLVNDLLDFAKLQAGKFDLSPQPAAYAPLLEEVADSLRPLADHKHVTIEVEAHVPGEPVVDETRVVQVLTNLVNNAIKFTPAGGRVRLSARIDAGALLTEVTDTGVGIAEIDIPKLFSRFRQLDMSATREASGTGLGLAISKALVEAHGGTIGVRSCPGEGSTFWFRLPLEAGVQAASPGK
ncbi:Signal transduction histidine-protein kinase BarA [compost metagenome]